MVPVLAGVLQGGIFGLLVFAAFINELLLHVSLALVFTLADNIKPQ